MKGIRVILFDLDDTLFDFTGCWEFGMKETMRLHPTTADLETEALYLRFEYYSQSLWFLQEEKKVTFNQYRRLRLIRTLKDFGRELNNDLADDFNRLFITKHLEAIRPSAMIIQMLGNFSNKYRLGIITNGPSDISYQKVTRLGIERFIDQSVVFVSEVAGYAKPDQRIFETALQHFDVTPSEAIFVGDNWKADITGAIDAGINAIWLNRHNSKPTTSHQPLAIIEKLEELEFIL
jgi:5'-nucleotidase